MDRSENVTALTKSLIAAQEEFPAIAKDAENDYFTSRYATLASVVDATAKILHANGLAVTQVPGGTHEAPTLTTTLLHESGEYISSEVPLYLNKRDSQGIGSAITYMRRYCYSAILGLVVDADDDGNAGSAPTQAPVQRLSSANGPPAAAAAVAQRAQQVAPQQATALTSPPQNVSGVKPLSDGQTRNIKRLFMVTKNDHGWSRDDWANQIELASDGQTRDDRKLTFDQGKVFISAVKSLIGEEDQPRQQQAPVSEPVDYQDGYEPF